MTKFRAIQYVDENVKYDEVYEGMTRSELETSLNELVGLAFDSYEIVEVA